MSSAKPMDVSIAPSEVENAVPDKVVELLNNIQLLEDREDPESTTESSVFKEFREIVARSNLSEKDLDYLFEDKDRNYYYSLLVPFVDSLANFKFSHAVLLLKRDSEEALTNIDLLNKKTKGLFNVNFVREAALKCSPTEHWGIDLISKHYERLGIALEDLVQRDRSAELYGVGILENHPGEVSKLPLELQRKFIQAFFEIDFIPNGMLQFWRNIGVFPLEIQKIVIDGMLDKNFIYQACEIFEAQSVYDAEDFIKQFLRKTNGYQTPLLTLLEKGVEIPKRDAILFAVRYGNPSSVVAYSESLRPLPPTLLSLAVKNAVDADFSSANTVEMLQRVARRIKDFGPLEASLELSRLIKDAPLDLALNLSGADPKTLENEQLVLDLGGYLIRENLVETALDNLLDYRDYSGISNLVTILTPNRGFNFTDYEEKIVGRLSDSIPDHIAYGDLNLADAALEVLVKFPSAEQAVLNFRQMVADKQEQSPPEANTNSERYTSVKLDREVLLFYIARGLKGETDAYLGILERPGTSDNNGLVSESREPQKIMDRAKISQVQGLSQKYLRTTFQWLDQYIIDTLYSEISHQDHTSLHSDVKPLADPYRVSRVPNIYINQNKESVRVFCERARVKFSKPIWGEDPSFGGAKWAQISEYAGQLWEDALPDEKRTFLVDRIVDYHHNTGHLFDKDPRLQISSEFQNLLDLKAKSTTAELISYGLEQDLITKEEAKEFQQAVAITSQMHSMPTKVKGYD